MGGIGPCTGYDEMSFCVNNLVIISKMGVVHQLGHLYDVSLCEYGYDYVRLAHSSKTFGSITI